MADIKREVAVERFNNFLSQPKYRHMIHAVADQYPEERSIYVDYKEIEDYDADLAEFLLKHPIKALVCADQAISEIMHSDRTEAGVELSLRAKTLPKKHRISKLRTSELGQTVAIEGLVRRVTEVRPRIVIGVYQCQRCSAIIKEPQDTWHPKEPLECYKEQNGCGRYSSTTKLKLLLDISQSVDSQKIEIQEPTENITPSAQPERIACYAEKDITGLVNPGDRIIVNGVLRAKQRSFPIKSTMLDTYIDINSIETQERVYDEIEITPGDEEKIIALSEDPRCYMNILNSIIPTVHGMIYEKEAVALQLFGGVPKDMPDGSRLRGDIHILLVGDPGTAKSTILRAVSRIAPRGIFASGKSTSGPGLTASVVRDEFGEGRWTVEAGAMALANGGHLCADELDKMNKEDRLAMHEAMAQQEFHLSKAGIHTLIQTRCPVLAAANPKEGRFDTTNFIVGQIDMPVTLLSRFDLIFSIIDIPDPERDSQIAKHILEGERVGQIIAQGLIGDSHGHSHESIAESLAVFEPSVDPKLLRKYIAYAKRNIVPVMDQEAMERMHGYYIKMRKGSGDESTIAITPRQLQAIVRLSEASARLHLSNTVEMDRDVERAIRIMEYYLRTVAGDEGKFDIDLIEVGISQSQRERMKNMNAVITDLAAEAQPIRHEDIVAEAEQRGMNRSQVETIIMKLLMEEGTIYETRRGSGEYRVAR